MMGKSLWLRATRRGFVGPRYSGVVGVVRQIWQELVQAREVILVADSPDLTLVRQAEDRFAVRFVRSWNEFLPDLPTIEDAYFPGFARTWQDAFGWGEELALVLCSGRIAGFCWLQAGTRKGWPCHYGRLLEGEYRVLRVGVLPEYRRQGVNTATYRLILRELAARGGRRVFVDCRRDNRPSLRAQLRAGFRPIAEIDVGGRLFRRGFVRWHDEVDHTFFEQLIQTQ